MTDVSVCAAVVPGGIATGMHTFIPHSVKRPPSDKPWFNMQCLRAVSAKNSAYRVWCKHSSSENRAKYIDAETHATPRSTGPKKHMTIESGIRTSTVLLGRNPSGH